MYLWAWVGVAVACAGNFSLHNASGPSNFTGMLWQLATCETAGAFSIIFFFLIQPSVNNLTSTCLAVI